jgi:hypothetical protein
MPQVPPETKPWIVPPPPEAAAEPAPAPAPEPPPAPAPGLEEKLASGEVSLSVDELNALFLKDKLAAHQGLTDKTITVTGVTEKVFVRDHLDVRYAILKGTQKSNMWSARCVFRPENVAQLKGVETGRVTAVRGKYDGYSKNIIFKDCVLG